MNTTLTTTEILNIRAGLEYQAGDIAIVGGKRILCSQPIINNDHSVVFTGTDLATKQKVTWK